MSFKTILACLTSVRAADQVLPLACALASRFGAHLTGMHTLDAVVPYPGIALHIDHPRMGGLVAEIEKEDAEVGEVFAKATRNADFPAEWRSVRAGATTSADALIRSAFRSDLVMALKPDRKKQAADEARVQQDLILLSGRPVLVVPEAWKARPTGTRIIVAWKPTREAARAVHDALPFLKAADAVAVVTVGDAPDTATEGHELGRILDRHGIAAEIRHLAHDPEGAGHRILAEAQALDCDLLVMGGYGRSRLRRIIFGDVTGHVLSDAPIPVLYSN